MSDEDPKAKPIAGKDTIYVDVDDDITTIIDKVEGAKQKVAALVLPKRASALQSIVNMRLLAKSADSADKNVVLITSEEALMPLAGAAGLHVAESLQSKPHIPVGPDLPSRPTTAAEPKAEAADVGEVAAEEKDLPTKIDYKKSIGELAAVHGVDHPETIEIGGEEEAAAAAKAAQKLPKVPKNKGIKVPNFDKFRLMIGAGIAGLIALIIFIILAVSVLPKATIAIQTVSSPVAANLTLTTSDKATALDETKSIIPGASKSSDQTSSQQVAATGQQNKGDKATGTVTMSITTDCATDVTKLNVPAGTGITSSGLTFIMQKSTNFKPPPAHGCTFTSDVTVTAQQGGAKYNLASGSNFTVPSNSSVTGSNSAAFSGGTDNIQTVVSQNDVDGAVAKLKSTSGDSFTKTFTDQLGQQGFYVLTTTLKPADPVTTASPDVGQPASTSTVSIKITYSVLVISKADLVKAVTDALNKQIDKTKQKVEAGDVLKGATVTVASQASPTVATLNIGDNASAVPIIDQATIKKQAVGKKTGDIISQISNLPGVKNVTVKLSPFWVSKAPKASKITVTLQHVTGQ